MLDGDRSGVCDVRENSNIEEMIKRSVPPKLRLRGSAYILLHGPINRPLQQVRLDLAPLPEKDLRKLVRGERFGTRGRLLRSLPPPPFTRFNMTGHLAPISIVLLPLWLTLMLEGTTRPHCFRGASRKRGF